MAIAVIDGPINDASPFAWYDNGVFIYSAMRPGSIKENLCLLFLGVAVGKPDFKLAISCFIILTILANSSIWKARPHIRARVKKIYIESSGILFG
jgi:hypothetical protein